MGETSQVQPGRARRRDSTGSLLSDAASNARSNAVSTAHSNAETETETETYIRASQASAREPSRFPVDHMPLVVHLVHFQRSPLCPRGLQKRRRRFSSPDRLRLRAYTGGTRTDSTSTRPTVNNAVPVQDGCGRSLRPALLGPLPRRHDCPRPVLRCAGTPTSAPPSREHANGPGDESDSCTRPPVMGVRRE